jgi:hypothetical protein
VTIVDDDLAPGCTGVMDLTFNPENLSPADEPFEIANIVVQPDGRVVVSGDLLLSTDSPAPPWRGSTLTGRSIPPSFRLSVNRTGSTP